MNKKSLSIVGQKELVLNLLNGTISSKLHLSEVLYSSKARYILISIGWLDETGFLITFTNKKYIYNIISSWVASVF